MRHTRQLEERSRLHAMKVAASLICWLGMESSVVLANPASPDTYHRACTARDVVGTWEVVKWRTLVTFDEKDKGSSYFHRHQLFQFAADGTLKSMTSTRPFDDRSSRAFARVPKVISYHFPSNGQLETTRTDLPGHRELWICHFVTRRVKDAPRQVDLRPGDVVMTLLDRQGKPVFIRQLRRTNDASGR